MIKWVTEFVSKEGSGLPFNSRINFEETIASIGEEHSYSMKYIPNTFPPENENVNLWACCMWQVERKKMKSMLVRSGYNETSIYYKVGKEFYWDNFRCSGLKDSENKDYSWIKLEIFQANSKNQQEYTNTPFDESLKKVFTNIKNPDTQWVYKFNLVFTGFCI
jgi:hypothetical protein